MATDLMLLIFPMPGIFSLKTYSLRRYVSLRPGLRKRKLLFLIPTVDFSYLLSSLLEFCCSSSRSCVSPSTATAPPKFVATPGVPWSNSAQPLWLTYLRYMLFAGPSRPTKMPTQTSQPFVHCARGRHREATLQKLS